MQRTPLLLLPWLLVVAACDSGGDPGTSNESLPSKTASATGAHVAGAAPWFKEVSAESGLVFRHISGHRPGRYLFPEMSGGTVCLFDYDGDGKIDVYLVQSGLLSESDRKEAAARGEKPPTSKLFRNLGGFKFEDVGERAGVAASGYGMGATAADYDGDGDVDLFVANVGDDFLFQNQGDGTFKEVAKEAGCSNPTWSSHASFADLDGDGDLDLFVSNYINWAEHREISCKGGDNNPDYCGPNNYKASAIDSLYRNEGDGRFRDVSREAGLETAYGNGFGVLIADFDRDGKPDVYVANDGNENQLWINQGGLRFANKALAMGCALDRNGVAQAGMGVATIDADANGFWDIFVTNLRDETNALYVYDGKKYFDDACVAYGLALQSRPFTGFGCGFADFDLDGRLDLYVANGAVMRPRGDPPSKAEPYGELNQVFRGVEGGKYEEIAPRGGTAAPLIHGSRGAAFGDLDDDGAVDVVVVNVDGPVYALRNVAPKRGGFVGLRVLDEKGRVAIGAEVSSRYGAMKRNDLVQPASSFNSCNDPRVVVGLGAATELDEVRVRFADGKTETFGPFKAGAYYDVRKGSGR
jgi:enediyne biosynthesis protein E4